MRISKKFITILIISILIISFGTMIIGCEMLQPTTNTQNTEQVEGTADGSETAEGQQATGGISSLFTSYGTWIWLAILAVAFYFLLIRPQRQRTKKQQDLMSNLQRGDEIITIGGFYGRIKDVRDDVITITIASGVDVKISKSGISKKISKVS